MEISLGMYWIKILRDFKRLFNYEKLCGIQSNSLSFQKCFEVFNQDFSSLKKSLMVLKIIQILKDCLINWILMDFVRFFSEILTRKSLS